MASKSASHSILRTATPSDPADPPLDATLVATAAAVAATSSASSLPSVERRLADLRPSRELLEFYRQKVAEYDDEYSELLKRFESLHSSQEDAKRVEEELKGRDAEVHQLQKALSDVQVFLMQERDNVVRLYAENDRLKLRQFEDSKKIQALLSLMGGDSSTGSGPDGAGEVTYFHREPPARAVVEREDGPLKGKEARSKTSIPPSARGHPASSRAGGGEGGGGGGVHPASSRLEEAEQRTEVEVAKLQIQALQAQLEEVTRTSREQIDVLTEDRRVAREESDSRVENIQRKTEEMRHKCDRLQQLLQQTTQDLLNEKQSHRCAEREWMSEKDRLLRMLDEAHDRGYATEEEEEGEEEGEEDEEERRRVDVIDLGAGGDGPGVGAGVGVGVGGAVSGIVTEVKQTADHGAQTLIPSLGALPPRPSRLNRSSMLRGPSSSSRSLRVVDAMIEKREKQHQLEIEALQNQLIQANKLSEMYRDQVIGVEGELSRLREEDSLNRTLFKERSDNVNRRLCQMKEKLASLEKRRLLEAEGYKTDIRLLRNRLKDAEKQIYRLTVSMPVADGDDVAMLKEVKIGAARAKKAQGEVNLLKAKIYGLEHQLKTL